MPPLCLRKRVRSSSDTSSTATNPDDNDNDEPPHHAWVLDEQHPEFLHVGEKYLLGIPGGNDWSQLLLRYVEFEGLAPKVTYPLHFSFRG